MGFKILRFKNVSLNNSKMINLGIMDLADLVLIQMF